MNLDDAFFPALRDFAASVGAPPDWFLAVFYLESRLDPGVGNALGYVGLNQMMGGYLQARGIDPADYLTWPASRQLTQVIGPWYKQVLADFMLGKMTRSAGGLYALNLYPASVGKRGDGPLVAVICSAGPTRHERAAYRANKALDTSGSGAITIGGLDAFLFHLTEQSMYREALARLGTPSTIPAPSFSKVAFFASAAAMFFLLYPPGREYFAAWSGGPGA
jgi:hypothetical protein